MSRTGAINATYMWRRGRELEPSSCLPEDPMANIFAKVAAQKLEIKIRKRTAKRGQKIYSPEANLLKADTLAGKPIEPLVEPKRPVLIGFGGGSGGWPEVHLPAEPEELRLSEDDWLILAQAASFGALGQ